MFCILSWRVFWITMIGRASPTVPPDVALTALEVQILEDSICNRVIRAYLFSPA